MAGARQGPKLAPRSELSTRHTPAHRHDPPYPSLRIRQTCRNNTVTSRKNEGSPARRVHNGGMDKKVRDASLQRRDVLLPPKWSARIKLRLAIYNANVRKAPGRV